MDEMSTSFLKKHNDARYLQKPYNSDTLARNVRELLDQAVKHPAANQFNARLVAA
jgi:hypothetical protein